MKKYLLSLAVLFAGTAVAQQYKAGDLEYEVIEGEEFLLSKDDMATTFLTQDSWNFLTKNANDSAKVVFVFTGETTDEGYDLYYIQFAATGEYIKDQELKQGADGSDLLEYKKPYIFTTTDEAQAAKWSVVQAETRYKAEVGDDDYIANWRVWTGVGTGTDSAEDEANDIQNKEVFDGAVVIMNAKLVEGRVDGEYVPVQSTYLEYMREYALFAPHGSNSWFLWYPEEMDAMEVLDNYAMEVLPNGVNYVVGDCPGQYDEASVAAVEAVYARYEALAFGESDEDPYVVLEDLKAAIAGLKVNPMREGYYYIEPNRQVPPNSGKKGLIFDDKGAIRAQEFARPEVLTPEAAKYIWYFKPAAEADVLDAFAEPKENAYYIQNYGTSKWATKVVAKLSGNDETTFTTGDTPAVYVFEYLTVIPGTVYIYTHQSKGKCTGTDSCPYCAAWNLQNHGQNYILKWNARWDEGNMMFLFPVDEAEVEAIRDQAVQYELNERLKELIDTAKDLYSRGISYKGIGVEPAGDFADHGYVKSGASFNVTCNAPESTEGYIEALADNDYNTFFHSTWSAYGSSPKPHNLIVDLGEGNSLDAVAVKILKRNTSAFNANRAPTELMVYGSNDNATWTEESKIFVSYAYDYQKVTEGEETNDTLTVVNGIGFGATGLSQAYRYLRFDVVNNLNNEVNYFFLMSEFGVWGAQPDPETSLNSVIPQELKSALLTELSKAYAEYTAGKATEAQVAALKAAYEAYLAEYPDPVRLATALVTAKDRLTNMEGAMGNEVGFYPREAVAAYAVKISEVEALVQPTMTVAAINAAIAQLEEALVALKKSLIMPEVGTYIRMRAASNNANFKNGIVYARGGDNERGIVLGFSTPVVMEYGDTMDNQDVYTSISSVWLVDDVEDNKVALRNVGTGLYLQANVPVNNQHAVLNTEKVMVELQADGLKRGGFFNLKMGVDSVSKKELFMNTMASYYLAGWHSASGTDHSSFAFEEVDLAEYDMAMFNVPVGDKATFVTLPVGGTYYNVGVYAYQVAGYCAADKMLYFLPIEDGAYIEAGTPVLVMAEEGATAYSLFQEGTISSIDDFTFSYGAKNVDGVYGTIFGQDVADNLGYLNQYDQIVATKSTLANGVTKLQRIGGFNAYVNGAEIPEIAENPGVDLRDLSTGYALELESLASITPGYVEEPEPELPQDILVAELEIIGGTDVMKVGESATLEVVVRPSDATNPAVRWSTSNTMVASVSSNGVVTARSEGVVYIRATSTDGSNITASKMITIQRDEEPGDSGDTGDGDIDLPTSPESYTNILYSEAMGIRAGKEFVLPVVMRNTEAIISCQFDLFLPAGIDVKFDNNGNEVAELNPLRAQRTHIVNAERLSNGSVRFICYSTRNDAFIGNDGSILDITLVADESLQNGDYEISYKNIVMTKTDAATGYEIDHIISKVTVQQLLGDVNADGVVNVVDVSDLVSYLLGISYKDLDLNSADVNKDGKINVIDVSGIVKIIIGANASNKKNEPVITPSMQIYNAAVTQLYVEPFSIQPGEEKDIYVNLNNPDLGVTSIEFNLLLPEGIEVVSEEGYDNPYYAFGLGSRADRSHVVEGAKMADDSYKVISFSNKNRNFSDNIGDVVVITVKAADDMKAGSYKLEVRDQVICDEELKDVAKGKTYSTITVGEATGINAIGNGNENQTIYDLQGRPSDGKKRGIYIINGKKVIK